VDEVVSVAAANRRVQMFQMAAGDQNFIRPSVGSVGKTPTSIPTTVLPHISTVMDTDYEAIMFESVVRQPEGKCRRINGLRTPVWDKNLCNANSERENALHPQIKPEGNYIQVRIGKHITDTLTDTGAVHSFISKQTAKFLKLKIEPINQQNYNPLVSATGSDIDMVGYTTAELYFKGLKVKHTWGVARHLSLSFLLGVDFLSENAAGIDYAIKPLMFTLFDGLIELPFTTRCDETNCVTLARTICIPAFYEAYLPVKVLMNVTIKTYYWNSRSVPCDYCKSISVLQKEQNCMPCT